jgi:glutaredoxin
MPRVVLLLMVMAFSWCSPAKADICKGGRANAAVHFRDGQPASISPAAQPEAMPGTVSGSNTFSGKDDWESNRLAPTILAADYQLVSAANYGHPKVQVYLTSWCPWCKKTLEFFRTRGIKVQAYDIERDSSAAKRKRQLDSSRGVPTTVINGQVIHGYSPAAFERALKNTQ